MQLLEREALAAQDAALSRARAVLYRNASLAVAKPAGRTARQVQIARRVFSTYDKGARELKLWVGTRDIAPAALTQEDKDIFAARRREGATRKEARRTRTLQSITPELIRDAAVTPAVEVARQTFTEAAKKALAR